MKNPLNISRFLMFSLLVMYSSFIIYHFVFVTAREGLETNDVPATTEVAGNAVVSGASVPSIPSIPSASVPSIPSGNKMDDLNDTVNKLQAQITAIQTKITNMEIKLESQNKTV